MTLAAVIGLEFPLYLLSRLAGLTDRETLTLLGDDFARARIMDGAQVGHYRFRDEATRAELYARLSVPQRVAWHRRTGELMEEIHAADLDAHAAALATHFHAAAADGDASKAIAYALRAAVLAQQRGDDGAAVQHFEQALSCLASPQAGDDLLRWRAWIGLAEALTRSATGEAARPAAEQSLLIARRLEEPTCFARSALAVAGRPEPFRSVASDTKVIGLLEDALARLAHRDDALHARLLARLAEELTFAPERAEESRDMARAALELARAQDDCGILGYVLRATHWALWSPSEAAARHALATAILTHNAASPRASAALELDAHLLRAWALIEMGDRYAARAELDGCARLAARASDAYPGWLVATTRVCLAFMTCELDRIPELIEEAYRLGCGRFDPNATLFCGIQTTYLDWLRGDMTQAEVRLQSISEKNSLLELPVRAALASTYAEAGRTDEARDELSKIAARGFGTLPRNLTWLPSMAFLAEACARLDDAEHARELYELLASHAKCNVLLVPAVSFGAADHFLGLLAATAGRPDQAEAHFRDAARRHEAMGARHMLARTRLEHATLLLARGRIEDRPAARAMLDEARAIADQLGMQIVAARAAAPEPPAARGGVRRVVLRRSGAVVTIESEGDPPSHYRCLKGFEYLAQLLRHPRWSVAALQLMQLADGSDPDAVGTLLADDDGGMTRGAGARPQQIADDKTERDARKALDELRAWHRHALEAEDHQEASRLAGQIEFCEKLLREMRSPIGKPRTFDDETERARQSVKKALERAFAAIETHRPDLARHLTSRVKTGQECCYDPGDPPDMLWIVLF